MSDRLTDEQVAQWARYDGAYDAAEVSALAREVQEWRQMAVDGKCVNADHSTALRMLDAIDALHQPTMFNGWTQCNECKIDGEWPCPTHRILHPNAEQR